MTRRFTETDKWQDEWFMSLPFEAKLLFLYLCDNCDCAGFWEVNYTVASRKTGLPLRGGGLLSGPQTMTVEDAMEELAAKLIWRDDGAVLFIKNFLKHQGNWPLLNKDPYSIGIGKRFDAQGSFGVHVLEVLRASQEEVRASDLLFGPENPLRKKKKESSFEGASKHLQRCLGKGIGIGNKGGVGGGTTTATRELVFACAVCNKQRYESEMRKHPEHSWKWICKEHELLPKE